jgi:integrase/recombinase XerD
LPSADAIYVGKEAIMGSVVEAKAPLQITLRRTPEGPLAPYISLVSDAMRRDGFRPYTIRYETRIVADFSRWLKQRRVDVHDLTTDCIEGYLRYRGLRRRPTKCDAAALRRACRVFTDAGLISERATGEHSNPARQYACEYARYLRDERGLSNATLLNYMPFVHRFLDKHFGNSPVRFDRKRAPDVVCFVREEAKRLSLQHAKIMTTALRSLLRYAHYRGDTSDDWSSKVPVVAGWSMSSIPRGVPSHVVQSVLSHCDQSTDIGRRDYAILLLLARLGLRAREIVSLTLDDIKWASGYLTVRGKGNDESHLPLPRDVGHAIAEYLQRSRPASNSRQIFLRAPAPHRPFRSSAAIDSVVSRALDRTQIEVSRRGAHQFRHGLATELLRRGASLSEIGEVLRHRYMDSTRIYAKVDVTSLRELAMAWPRGV